MVIVNTKSCFYSGDINQDGSVTLTDVVTASNDAAAFKTGYVNSDVNGDKVVNLEDILIVFNNSSAFVSVKRP